MKGLRFAEGRAYDEPDYTEENLRRIPSSDDWALYAARGVIANLRDRRGIKHGFERIDEEIRSEIVQSLAMIIRAAYEVKAGPCFVNLEVWVKKVEAWDERYPKGRVYPYNEGQKCEEELTALVEEAKGILKVGKDDKSDGRGRPSLPADSTAAARLGDRVQGLLARRRQDLTHKNLFIREDAEEVVPYLAALLAAVRQLEEFSAHDTGNKACGVPCMEEVVAFSDAALANVAGLLDRVKA